MSSLFFGNQVYADVDSNTIAPSLSDISVQNAATALQVSDPSQVNGGANNISPVAIDDSGTAIVPTASLIGTPDCSGEDVYYQVQSGDSFSGVAKMFGVTVNTILSANDMKKGDALTPGDTLLILPCSGVQYTVKAKDTLQKIADHYGVDVNDIIQNNDIASNTSLTAGETLIIPNAEEKSTESATPISNKDLSSVVAKAKQYYENHPSLENIASYFISPLQIYRLSQGIHDNNAVDMAIGTGTPIYAAASGKVLLARDGYNGGFGNVVIIDHPNGTQTLYAHQSKILTQTGAEVSQGEEIGLVGETGHATGPHLHFEVHGARNPGVDDSWASWSY